MPWGGLPLFFPLLFSRTREGRDTKRSPRAALGCGAYSRQFFLLFLARIRCAARLTFFSPVFRQMDQILLPLLPPLAKQRYRRGPCSSRDAVEQARSSCEDFPLFPLLFQRSRLKAGEPSVLPVLYAEKRRRRQMELAPSFFPCPKIG